MIVQHVIAIDKQHCAFATRLITQRIITIQQINVKVILYFFCSGLNKNESCRGSVFTAVENNGFVKL
jgi:hypothetical protein